MYQTVLQSFPQRSLRLKPGRGQGRAALTMILGNLLAIWQTNIKRLLAYSSIAHAGYLFYAFLGDGPGRFQAVTFYLLAYGLMNVLVLAALPPAGDDVARDRLERLKGLFQRQPYAAWMIAVAMLSLAGFSVADIVLALLLLAYRSNNKKEACCK